MSTRWYTATEVAAQLRVSKVHVYRLLSSGEIPSIKIGGTLRIPSEWVEGLQKIAMQGRGIS